MENDNRTPPTPANGQHLPHLYSVLQDMKENMDQVRLYKDAISRVTFGAIFHADNANYYAEDVFFIDKIYELLCLIEEAAEAEAENK